jgi:hypothetical protein
VIADSSGELLVRFSAPAGADIEPGQLVQITGKARRSGNGPVYMSNPRYRILAAPEPGPQEADENPSLPQPPIRKAVCPDSSR